MQKNSFLQKSRFYRYIKFVVSMVVLPWEILTTIGDWLIDLKKCGGNYNDL